MNVTEFIKSHRVYLDGAIGTELIRAGFDASLADGLNLSNPQAVTRIANSYLDAGSNIVFTNSFGCNLLKHGNAENLRKIIISAVENAKSAVRDRENAYVGYSAGPLSELMAPYGKLSFEEAYRQYKFQADILAECPPDFVVLETFTDVWLLKAALLAFKENTDLPVWCSMSFNDNGRTFGGSRVENFVLIAEGLGADVLGINCGFGPDKMLPLAKRLTECASVPVYVKPNAGLPVFKDGKTGYDVNAVEFADYMADIARLGVSILGGCCGTTPEYIEKTIAKTRDIPYKFFDNKLNAVCSAAETVEIKPFLKIGERVNPTGKPRLKQALLDKNFDYVLSMCADQLEKGADILDINVGMSGIDEAALLAEAVTAIQCSVNCPLMLDSGKYDAMAQALRVVNGVPVINSVNGDDDCLDALLPLAKKYGAYLVAICLDKNGIPDTAEGRVAIAHKILAKAEEYGIDRSRILFDGLTMAVSVDKHNPEITLKTVKALNSMSLNTVLGLSNVSFGLPAREVINGAFLTLAKEAGLTAAIINPDTKANENPAAITLLEGGDENCESYIGAFGGYTPPKPAADFDATLYDCIIKGMKREGLALAKSLANAENYFTLINRDIIGALNEVGRRYEEGIAFLPQLIISAETAGAMLDYIKTQFIKEENDGGTVMLIATVKGDIHDIGKNIVKAVLSNYGYKIYDLGKDVSVETIIENLRLRKPEIVGLSALMTTSLDSMREAVKAVKEFDSNIAVMIGGAVVTEDFRREIGADIYSADAQEAVRKLDAYFKHKK